MDRSTADFLARLDATGMRPQPKPARGVCPDCRRELCACSTAAGRERRYRYNCKRRGRCRCGDQARPGMTECQPCADRRAEELRRRRAERKAAGRCVRCPNQAAPGRAWCRWCLEGMARRRRGGVTTAGRPAGSGARTRWTPAEDDRVRQAAADNQRLGYVPGGRLPALAAELGRTLRAVRQRAVLLGAKSR